MTTKDYKLAMDGLQTKIDHKMTYDATNDYKWTTNNYNYKLTTN